MDLFENPFYILDATPLDNIHKIGELAEARSLLSDAKKCMKARATLTHPRDRVAAEVAWLPSMKSDNADEMLMLLETSAGNDMSRIGFSRNGQNDSLAAALSRLPCTDTYNVADEVLDMLKLPYEDSKHENITKHKRHSYKVDNLMHIRQYLGMDKMNAIARSNILAARLLRLPNHTANYVANWILAIAQSFDAINPEELCAIINVGRREVDIPEITDISVVATEIQKRRHYYQQVIKTVLTRIHSAKERLNAIMQLVDYSSDIHEKNRKPILIDDTIDAYTVKTTPILENEEKIIKKYDMELRYAADTLVSDATLTSLVNKLIQAVKNWQKMAQPILLQKKRLGFNDTESYRVAMDVRRLAVYLYAEHEKLDISQQILIVLKEVFADIPTIVDSISPDLETLNRIAERRNRKS